MANSNTTSFWLDPPQIIGRNNPDGTNSLTPLELKRLNDFNYYVAKMLQGGLNLANLNADTKQVFTDIEGNIASVQATATELETRVSNAEGNIVTAQQTANSASVTASNALGEVQSVKLTVDGLTIADETSSYTIIDGDKLVSFDHSTTSQVKIENGEVILLTQGDMVVGGLFFDANESKIILKSDWFMPLKIISSTNMSIDSNGTIYIGTSSGYSGDVNIGQEGGTVNLIGDVRCNGSPIGTSNDSTKTYITVSGIPESTTAITPLSVARSSLTAATDGNGNVLFGGGYDGTNRSAVVDKYDTTGTRTTLTNLSAARENLAAATDGNGNVLFGGGYTGSSYSAVVDKYDTTGTRTTLTNLSVARLYFTAATDGNGNVLFGGGATSSASSVVDKYDTTGTRTTLTSLSVARYSLTAATDGNGNVLFGGGHDGTNRSAVVDKYDTTGTRTTLTSLSVARSSFTAATDGNGNVLFGGGIDGTNNRSAVVDKYDTTGTRTTLTSLSVARNGLAAATDGNGNVLFGGGYTGSSYSAVVDKYDTTGTRTTLTNLSVARNNFTAATDGNGNVLFGGGATSSASSVVDKYTSANLPKKINIPPLALYKFEEHTTEQRAPQSGTITVNTPNTGYFRFGGTVEL